MGNGGEAGSVGWGIGMGGRAFGRVFLSRMAGLWQLSGSSVSGIRAAYRLVRTSLS